jgi:succinate dehydrogenase/fumarate reductase cytochrome b subunit
VTADDDTGPKADAARTRRLIRVQAISGLVFLSFAGVHLANTMLATAGEGAYDGFQRAARLVYQFPVVELVIVGALFVHVAAAVMRIAERRRQKRPSHVPRRLFVHRLSGYFLLAVVFGHIVATRGPSLVSGIYPEFIGLNFSLTSMPWFFFPYYIVFGIAGLYHGLNGATVALTAVHVRLPEALRRGPVFVAGVSLGALLVLLGVLSIGGVIFPVTPNPDHPFARLLTDVGAALGVTL